MSSHRLLIYGALIASCVSLSASYAFQEEPDPPGNPNPIRWEWSDPPFHCQGQCLGNPPTLLSCVQGLEPVEFPDGMWIIMPPQSPRVCYQFVANFDGPPSPGGVVIEHDCLVSPGPGWDIPFWLIQPRCSTLNPQNWP